MKSLLPIVGVLGALTTAVTCQVPAGHYVVSSFKTFVYPDPSRAARGDGGIFFVNPRLGSFIPVTNLPVGLTGRGRTSGSWGANCVAHNALDGTLVVGETVGANTILQLHILTLRGFAVHRDRQIKLGSGVASEVAVSQVATLPDGDIVMATYGITAGPLAGAALARFSPSSGRLTVVCPASRLGGFANALTVDDAGTTAYVGTFSNQRGEVWEVSLRTGTAKRIVTLPGGLMNLAMAANGELIAGLFSLSNPRQVGLLRMDPTTRKQTPLLLGMVGQAVAVERATGGLVLFQGMASTPAKTCIAWMAGNGGTQRRVTCGPATGWGFVTGIAVHHNPATYGDSTPKPDGYVWDTSPNPGGLPTIMNSRFGLRLVAKSQPFSSMLFASPGRANLRFGAVRILLDTARLVGPFAMPIGRSVIVPMPLPRDLGLIGVSVNFQSLHVDSRGLAASNGVTMTVF